MNLFILTFPDFPYLADEIAEPLPDMNIKVAAFTVIEKSSKTCTLKKISLEEVRACHFIKYFKGYRK